MEVYFLDACSVIAFFQKEPGFEKVRELLEKSDVRWKYGLAQGQGEFESLYGVLHGSIHENHLKSPIWVRC